MTLTTERQQFAEQNEMSLDFVNWFFDEKKESCGNAWFIMAAAMWEGWKGRANRETQQPVMWWTGPEPTPTGERESFHDHETGSHYIALYTAPPAPANAVAWEMRFWNSGYGCWNDWERITEEQHTKMSVWPATGNNYEFRVLYDAPPAPQSTNAADWGINTQTGTPILVYKNCSVIESEQAHYALSLINGAAMPAPAVPGELLDAMEEVIRISDRDHEAWDKAKAAITACRAAMLKGERS